MRKALRRGLLLLLLLAASVLAVPAVANGRVLGDLYGSGEDAADARRSGRSLNAVGLTTDGRLVRFSTDTPGRTRSIGLLAATGKLQVDAGTSVGFDIYSRNRFGVTQGNRGFATVSVLGRYSLFQVNLLAGKLSRVGGFRADTQVVDLAIPLDQG